MSDEAKAAQEVAKGSRKGIDAGRELGGYSALCWRTRLGLLRQAST